MKDIICQEDLKTLAQGVSVVAVAGLLLGLAAHPNLRGPDDAAGPRMELAGGGPRMVQAASDPGMAAYGARVPEYVIGTDATRPQPVYQTASWQADEPQDDTPAYAAADESPVQMRATRTVWRDEPREPPLYPSARGGAYYEHDLPRPPPEPEYDDEDDAPAAGAG